MGVFTNGTFGALYSYAVSSWMSPTDDKLEVHVEFRVGYRVILFFLCDDVFGLMVNSFTLVFWCS